MTEITMKNQPSKPHWWCLDEHTGVRRSTWLQSTLNELNEKTKAMLKLIEADADSFAQRAEMFYKKRPELVSMVEDFYKIHRLLAERYDQVRPEAGIRLFPPSACLKHSQSEKFGYRGYDSYSENCDVEESVESEIDDPEHEGEVRSVATNEVAKLLKEIEKLSEVKKTDKDQSKQKDDILDEVIMLREEIERLRKENEAHKNELAQKDTVFNEVVMNLRDEIEQLKKDNKTVKDDQVRPEAGIRLFPPSACLKRSQSEKFDYRGYDSYSENCDVEESVESEIDDPEHEGEVRSVATNEVAKLLKEIEKLSEVKKTDKDQSKQKDDILDEVIMLREEIERLRKENEAHKNELAQKDTIFNEVVMNLRDEIEQLKKDNKTVKDEAQQKNTICREVMKLKEEIVRLRKENEAQKKELEKKDTNSNEVMKLRKELERHKKENKAQKEHEDSIRDEVTMLKEERESLREENRTQKDDLRQKDKEKIEVIRQLSTTIDLLKQENIKMKSFIAGESAKKWKTPFEFNKLIETFSGKLFKGGGPTKNKPSVVAL